MDCKKADLAMMQHMEKSIKPADARDLAQHILCCEQCREYFLAFDEAMECLTDAHPVEAPADFTESVMIQVRKLPVYTKQSRVSLPINIIQVLWGLSAILLGVGLLFILNPEWLNAYPAVAEIINVLGVVPRFFGDRLDGFLQVFTAQADMPNINVVALIFAVMVGVLLIVLHRSEKSVNT